MTAHRGQTYDLLTVWHPVASDTNIMRICKLVNGSESTPPTRRYGLEGTTEQVSVAPLE
jgi:hypothetical protein